MNKIVTFRTFKAKKEAMSLFKENDFYADNMKGKKAILSSFAFDTFSTLLEIYDVSKVESVEGYYRFVHPKPNQEAEAVMELW